MKNAVENIYDRRDPHSIPGSGRSPGEGNGNPLQYSCLEKSHGQRNLAGYSPWSLKESKANEHTGKVLIILSLDLFTCEMGTIILL